APVHRHAWRRRWPRRRVRRSGRLQQRHRTGRCAHSVLAGNPVVARAITCPSCGSKIRASRKKCPRCHALLAALDPSIAAEQSRKLARVAAVVAGTFALVVIALWLMRDSAPSTASAARIPRGDPFAGQRPKAGTNAAGAGAIPIEEIERPFL